MKKRFGPEFQETGSAIYRAEYGAICMVVVGYLAWRGLFLGGINVLQTIFWAIFPDLMVFIPIAFSSKRQEWPKWGIYLYDTIHTVITWGVVFLVVWIVFGVPAWPLLGWLGHITVDRTVGYGLRKVPNK